MKILLTSDTHYGIIPSKTALILRKFIKKIKAEQPDVILHAGDWGSTQQKEMESCLKLFRSELGMEIPIIGVLGNHCYGSVDKPTWLLCQTKQNLRELFTKYNIINRLTTEDVEIFGYNSWYKTNRPPSNDHYWIGALTKEDAVDNSYDWLPTPKARNIHQHLMEQSYLNCQETCEAIKLSTAKQKIVVTHFETIGYRNDPFYDGMKGSIVEYEMLQEAGANVICYGHSHRPSDFINEQGVRILNCGSDYNEPKFKVL